MIGRCFDEDINQLTSEDGSASLILVRADPSRDFGGGYVYKFSLLNPSHTIGPLTGEVLISNISSIYARKHYEKLIPNFSRLGPREKIEYYHRYEVDIGAVLIIQYLVNANFDTKITSNAQFSEIAFFISQLYFRRYSIKSFDDNEINKYYDDRMIFEPRNPEIAFSITYTPAEVLGHV